jgi:hypothetical protein
MNRADAGVPELPRALRGLARQGGGAADQLRAARLMAAGVHVGVAQSTLSSSSQVVRLAILCGCRLLLLYKYTYALECRFPMFFITHTYHL